MRTLYSVQPEPELHKLPSGNSLVKRPEWMQQAAWKQITVETINSGQTRAYGPSVKEAYITIRGGTPSTKDGFDLPFGTGIEIEKVKKLAHGLGFEFVEENPSWADWRLVCLERVHKSDFESVWFIATKQEYLD